MSKTHWKTCLNKEYIGAWYCIDGDKELTIDRVVKAEEVTGEKGRKDTEPVIHFKERGENGKALKMVGNSTNMKVLEDITGSPFIENWAGYKILVWADPDVMFGGVKVGGIRVRPFLPKTDEIICTDCGSVIEGSGKYSAKVIAERAKSKYGTYLCMDCAMKRSEAERPEAEEEEADE